MISVGSVVQVHPGPPEVERGHSSAGRAPALQAGGRRFDPDWLQKEKKGKERKGREKEKEKEKKEKEKEKERERWGKKCKE